MNTKKSTELTKEDVTVIETKLNQFVEDRNIEEIGKLLNHPHYEIRAGIVYKLGELAGEIVEEDPKDPKFKQIINLLFIVSNL